MIQLRLLAEYQVLLGFALFYLYHAAATPMVDDVSSIKLEGRQIEPTSTTTGDSLYWSNSTDTLGGDPTRYPIPGSDDLVLINVRYGANMGTWDFNRAIEYSWNVVWGVEDKSKSLWEKNQMTIAMYENSGDFVKFTTQNQRQAERLIYQDMADIILGLEKVYRDYRITPKASTWKVVKGNPGWQICQVEIGKLDEPPVASA